jgi:hypothetical protein
VPRLPEGEVIKLLRRGQNEDWRGSPFVNQFHLDQFLKMLQDDVGEVSPQVPIQGQLVQLAKMGETEWVLKLAVPISDILGMFLLGRLEDLL